MTDTSLGRWLRRERERRGVTLRSISEQTKVSLPLLQGLEDDDVSRWPGGIFRRAFVRSYATAIGLDPEEIVRRFELEHGAAQPLLPGETPSRETPAAKGAPAAPLARSPTAAPPVRASIAPRVRAIGTAADLAFALVLGLGSAAAGSRLLWPVLLIAVYYAVGVLLTGTSPMVALLAEEETPIPVPAAPPAVPELPVASAEAPQPVRRPLRVVRTARAARRRAQ